MSAQIKDLDFDDYKQISEFGFLQDTGIYITGINLVLDPYLAPACTSILSIAL